MSHFLTVCLNPTIQRTLSLEAWAPSAVNRVQDSRVDASGKGVNVSRILAQLGEPVVHLTHSGGMWADFFASECQRAGITMEAVPSSTEIRTCVTVLDRRAGTTTEFVEPAQEVETSVEQSVLERFRRLLFNVHTVILSGSTAPGYSVNVFPEMVRLTKEAGACVIADYRGAPLLKSLEHRPDLVKTNLQEFALTFFSGPDRFQAEESNDADALKEAKRHMQRLFQDGVRVVLTRGGNPALFVDDDGTVRESSPVPLNPVNTIGSGDAFAAGMAASLNRGDSIQDALEHGHACAAMNASQLKPGSLR